MTKILFSLVVPVLLFALGCGVKGKPLPPLEAPPFSDGEWKARKQKVDPNSQKPKTRPAIEVDREEAG